MHGPRPIASPGRGRLAAVLPLLLAVLLGTCTAWGVHAALQSRASTSAAGAIPPAAPVPSAHASAPAVEGLEVLVLRPQRGTSPALVRIQWSAPAEVPIDQDVLVRWEELPSTYAGTAVRHPADGRSAVTLAVPLNWARPCLSATVLSAGGVSEPRAPDLCFALPLADPP